MSLEYSTAIGRVTGRHRGVPSFADHVPTMPQHAYALVALLPTTRLMLSGFNMDFKPTSQGESACVESAVKTKDRNTEQAKLWDLHRCKDSGVESKILDFPPKILLCAGQ